MDKPTKLVLAGLDQAGKSTIYQAAMEELAIAEAADQSPTRGIERHDHSFLDHDFAVWDLGGQKNYRETYLSKPEVFAKTTALVFVVDIQDMPRLDEAYDYYVDILNTMQSLDTLPRMYVFFHKFDPDLIAKLRANFYKATRKFRQADHLIKQKFKGYATSIYSNSIQLAIKRTLVDNIEGYREPPETVKREPKKKEEPVPTTSSKSEKVVEEKFTEVKTPVPSIPTSSTTTETSSSASFAETDDVQAPEPLIEESIPAPVPVADQTAPAPAPVLDEPEPVSEEVQTQMDLVDELTGKIVDEEEINETLEEATPKSLLDLSDTIVENLTNVINKRMKEIPEIVAFSILSADGDQVMAIAKDDGDYEKLDILKEVVGSLNPRQFFKELTDVEYRGLGHISLSDFDIYFAKASEDYAIALVAIDVSTMMLENAQKIVTAVRQGINMVELGDEEDEVKEEEKKDIVSDLKSRLKAISGLDDI